MTGYAIAVLPGDGIGPEVIDVAISVLNAAVDGTDLQLTYQTYQAGAALYRDTGEGITPATMQAIGAADAILFGAMGLPDVRRPDGTEVAPQLDMREQFHLFASLRPARLLEGVPRTVHATNVDMLVIRETTEGLFAGRHDPPSGDDDSESDRMTITRATSEQLFELAFAQAAARRRAGRRGHVTLLDKSNVLKSNAFMRSIFNEVAARHPDIETDRLYIDAAAMMMVTQPERFDVVVTENMFGDIVSELAAGISGGLGLAPSADVGVDHAVFQPCHGSAPDLAGRDIANPVGTILSGAMLLDWLGERNNDQSAVAAARSIQAAVAGVLKDGVSTRDIGGTAGTRAVGKAVIAALANENLSS
jgi:3-isopropylmalate dehydrogenase